MSARDDNGWWGGFYFGALLVCCVGLWWHFFTQPKPLVVKPNTTLQAIPVLLSHKQHPQIQGVMTLKTKDAELFTTVHGTWRVLAPVERTE